MGRILILLSLFTLWGGDDRSGRRGNAHFRAERYAEAAEAYREGISSLDTREPGHVASGLLNNLGAALYRQDDFQGALDAFASAFGMSAAPADAARAAYNAGNAAFRNQAPEDALSYYRRALLRNPSDEDARFNYEFVKRQLDEQQQQQQQQDQENQDQENQDQQQQQDQENQDQENQDQQQQDQQDQQQQDQPQQQEPQDPEELSREEAERMLEALQNDEEQLLRQVQKMKARPRRVEKDW